ncbi:MAG: hypothetical protein MUF18_07125 [Fimbriiglobus sp.]|nr:hypothetical protein [Fimbriiglobus sp.]
MKRLLSTAAMLLAGLSAAHAQTITPGLGGVAITGQSGAGVYLPWGGGAVVGAPGVGSYILGSGTYTSPYSWTQYSNPTAYNFNTGSFNYNSGLYGWNNGLTTTSYYGTPYTSGNVILNSGYTTYPYTYGNTYYGGRVYTPAATLNHRGRHRWR